MAPDERGLPEALLIVPAEDGLFTPFLTVGAVDLFPFLGLNEATVTAVVRLLNLTLVLLTLARLI